MQLNALMCVKTVLMYKNDMEDVDDEELAEDRDDIKASVKEMIEASGDLRYDLIFEGGSTHAWVTELSSVEQDGSFESFIERILSNEFSFEDMKATYVSSGKSFEVQYDESFKLNGEFVDTEYARYESDYGLVERKAKTMNFSMNGKSLTLDFEEGTRKQ